MEVIDPRVNPSLVPVGSCPRVLNGPRGDEYLDLPAVITPTGYIITRWTFTDEERRQIAFGEDVYITLRSCGQPITPLFATVGVVDWTEESA